jgi:hypothetical protein
MAKKRSCTDPPTLGSALAESSSPPRANSGTKNFHMSPLVFWSNSRGGYSNGDDALLAWSNGKPKKRRLSTKRRKTNDETSNAAATKTTRNDQACAASLPIFQARWCISRIGRNSDVQASSGN